MMMRLMMEEMIQLLEGSLSLHQFLLGEMIHPTVCEKEPPQASSTVLLFELQLNSIIANESWLPLCVCVTREPSVTFISPFLLHQLSSQ
jgi:hypothetical protein